MLELERREPVEVWEEGLGELRVYHLRVVVPKDKKLK